MYLNPKNLSSKQIRVNFESKDLEIIMELDLTKIGKGLQIFVVEVIGMKSIRSSH